jgi:hypothetical protein
MGEARRKRLLREAQNRAKLKEIRQPNYSPANDPEFRAGVATLVRAVEFPTRQGGGNCLLRALVALEVLRDFHLDPTLHVGALLCRVGPDPYRDVLAFCGPGNAGFSMDERGTSFHAWIGVGGNVVDFAVGDWYAHVQRGEYLQHELQLPRAPQFDPIQWTIPQPPTYWWRPRAELVKPWRPKGTPELGEAWYGPFNGDPLRMAAIVRQLRAEAGAEIAAAVNTVFGRAAQQLGIERPLRDPVESSNPQIIIETAAVPAGLQQTILSAICRIAGLEGSAELEDAVAYVTEMPTTAKEAIALLRNMTLTVPPGSD